MAIIKLLLILGGMIIAVLPIINPVYNGVGLIIGLGLVLLGFPIKLENYE